MATKLYKIDLQSLLQPRKFICLVIRDLKTTSDLHNYIQRVSPVAFLTYDST